MTTVREVAKAAAVSPAVVSYAINGTGGSKVNEKTRARVLAVAKAMNFTPNVHAKRLFSHKSEMIGILLPSFAKRNSPIFNDHHLAGIFSGLEEALSETPYRLSIIFNDNRFAAEKEYLSLFRTCTLDGMLIWGSCAEEDFWQEFAAENHPHVFLTPPPHPLDINYMYHDYRNGGKLAMEYLASQGHAKFLWMGGFKGNGVNQAIESGFADYLAAHEDLDLMREYGGFYGETAAEKLAVALTEGNGFSAVICGNIAIAAQVRKALHAAGCADIPLVSCDCSSDSEVPDSVSDIPRIVVDDFELGRRALNGLLELINHNRTQLHETCPVKLVFANR